MKAETECMMRALERAGICRGQKRKVEDLSDTGRYVSRNTEVVKSQFRPQLKPGAATAEDA